VPALVHIEGLKFLDEPALAAMFMLSADLGPVPVEVNRLDNQSLVRYYEAEWRRYE
jgi:spermidine synthase